MLHIAMVLLLSTVAVSSMAAEAQAPTKADGAAAFKGAKADGHTSGSQQGKEQRAPAFDGAKAEGSTRK